MKRYKDISYTLQRISPLREDKNGEWVKYKDMLKEIRKFVDDLGGIGSHVSDEDIERYFDSKDRHYA